MPERVAAGVLGAHLGVIAVRFDLYNRARNGTANGYERPAHQVGGGMEFDNPRATENARGDPSLVGAREQRRRHSPALHALRHDALSQFFGRRRSAQSSIH